jgi:hypothetical protein
MKGSFYIFTIVFYKCKQLKNIGKVSLRLICRIVDRMVARGHYIERAVVTRTIVEVV